MGPSQYEVGTSGAVVAFRSVKTAKNVFMLLLALALLAQLAAFVLVGFLGVIDDLHKPAAAQAPTTAPAPELVELTQPTEPVQADNAASGRATMWSEALLWALPATKFLGFVSALLAVLTLLFAVKLSLIGRLGGIAGFISALFWSIFLLAMVTPWQQVLDSTFATGALCNLGELTEWTARVRTEWGAAQPDLLDQVLYYGRFAGFQGIALLVWLVVMVKFAGGYKDSIVSPIGTIPSQPAPEPRV